MDERLAPQRQIRQRLSRNEVKAKKAQARGDWPAAERYLDLLDRDTDAYAAELRAFAELTGGQLPPEPTTVPTRAAEFTPESTVDMTDDELLACYAQLHDDPLAQDAILAVMDHLDQADRARDAELAEMASEKERARAAVWAVVEGDDPSPLTNPAARRGRKLTPDQVCREGYDAYVYDAYLCAETDCRGVLLTREAVAKGIDPAALFEGPAHVARRWASEELRSWWASHGRTTYAEWRFQWFGRQSDRAAAQTARRQSLGEAVA